jgi:hypothetical protein
MTLDLADVVDAADIGCETSRAARTSPRKRSSHTALRQRNDSIARGDRVTWAELSAADDRVSGGLDTQLNDEPTWKSPTPAGLVVLTKSLQIGHKYFISLAIVRFWCEAVHSRMFGLHTDCISIANVRGGRDLFDWYDSCDSRLHSRTSTRRTKPVFERDESLSRTRQLRARSSNASALAVCEATFTRSTRTSTREDDIGTALELWLEERCDPRH